MKLENFYKWVIIALLLINAGTLIFILTAHRRQGPPPKCDRMLKELGLNPKQEAEFLRLREAHHRQMLALDEKETKWHKLLFTGIQDSLSKQSYADSLGANFKTKEWITLTHFRQVRAMLNEEQVAKFDAMIERASEQALRQPPKGSHPPRD